MPCIGLPVDRLSDEALVAGFGAGDAEISVAFIRRFQRKVYGVALMVTSDAHLAEDVAQQAFERAWRHAGNYDPRRASVGTWLATITRNLAIDTVRSRRPEPLDPEELLMRIGPTTTDLEGSVLATESARQVTDALRSLPREQVRAVVLASMAGFTAAEIATREGIPLGTAKTRIRAGLRRLRSQLLPDPDPDHDPSTVSRPTDPRLRSRLLPDPDPDHDRD